jgi:tetratricopeptide (TPR) repeat protein
VTATTEPAPARNVIPLPVRRTGGPGDGDARLHVLAPLLAGAVALTALDGGLYDYARWGLLAGVMLAVLTGLLIAGKVGTFGRLAPTVLALAGLAAWTSASILWADSPDRAWTESDRLVLYTAVFAICVVALRTPRDVHRSLAVVGAVIAAAALYTVVALLRGDPSAFLDHRLDMPIGYVNGAAGLFLIGLWPLVSLAERATRPLIAGAAMALAVVEANLLVLTQSRAILPAVLVSAGVLLALYPGRTTRAWTLLVIAAGTAAGSAWTLPIYADRIPLQPRPVGAELSQPAAVAALVVAVLAGLIWAAVARLRRTRSSPRTRRLAALGAIAAGVVVLAAAVVATGDPLSRAQQEWRAFTALDLTERSSTRFTGAGGFRHDLWRVALADLRREPLHGVGAGSYGLSYYQQRRQRESIRQPHSLPLQILAELGLVGGVLALIAATAAVAAIVRNRRADVAAGVAGAGMAASWATQTSLDWLHNLPGVTCIALVGVVAASGATPFAALAGPRRRLMLIGAAVLIALAAASLGRHYSADAYAERARNALPRDPARALSASATSLELDPYAVETLYTQAAAYARVDDYARARDALMRAAAREPLNFVPWALLGDLATRRQETGHARAAYRRAARLNPRDDQLRELAADPGRALR